jgi:uncharacterized phiE125 gp8 family phage protein
MYWTQTAIAESDPGTEPVSADNVQDYGRIYETADETLLTSFLIPTARRMVEKMTNRATTNRSVVAYWDKWPDTTDQDESALILPRSPVAAITSVKYYDEDETLTTWSSSEYDADLNRTPARITLAYGESYPTVYDRPDTIQVSYTAGYGTSASDVPASLRVAIMALTLAIYEHREMSTEAVLNENPSIAAIIANERVGL